jgi:hypothetical protein
VGCVIGAGLQEQVFLKALRCDIEFEAQGKAIAAPIRSALEREATNGCPDAWLPAFGLALYSCADAIGRVAA